MSTSLSPLPLLVSLPLLLSASFPFSLFHIFFPFPPSLPPPSSSHFLSLFFSSPDLLLSPPSVLYSLAYFSNPHSVSQLKAFSSSFRPVVSLCTIRSALALGFSNSLTSSLPFLSSLSVVFFFLLLHVLSLSSFLLISPLKCLHFTKHGVNLPHFTQTSWIAGLENEQQNRCDDGRVGLMRPLGVNRKQREGKL